MLQVNNSNGSDVIQALGIPPPTSSLGQGDQVTSTVTTQVASQSISSREPIRDLFPLGITGQGLDQTKSTLTSLSVYILGSGLLTDGKVKQQAGHCTAEPGRQKCDPPLPRIHFSVKPRSQTQTLLTSDYSLQPPW